MHTHSKKLTLEDLIPFKASHILDMQVSEKDKLLFELPDLFKVYEDFNSCYTFKIEDTIYACGGVIKLWGGLGELWFVLADEDKKPTHWIGSVAKEYVDNLFNQGFHRVQATIKHDDEKAIRFIEWLGFQRETLMRCYGTDGDDYYLYARGIWQQ